MEERGQVKRTGGDTGSVGKDAVKSKTVWFNLLLVLISVGTFLINDEVFKQMVGDNIGIIGTIVGVLGFILRAFTSEPLRSR